MQITHMVTASPPEEGAPRKLEKRVYKNVIEITYYHSLPHYSMVYWVDFRTGPRAYMFPRWSDENPTLVVFESAGEAARFKEDLRLQEHAGRSNSTQALTAN